MPHLLHTSKFIFLVLFSLATSWSRAICLPNNSPLRQLHYTPCFESLLGQSVLALTFSSERSNIFYKEGFHELDTESVSMDGEVARHAVQVAARSGGWQWLSRFESYQFEPGFLDEHIEGWHNSLQQTNRDREEFAQDQVDLTYQSDRSNWVVNKTTEWKKYIMEVSRSLGVLGLSRVYLGTAQKSSADLIWLGESYWFAISTTPLSITPVSFIQVHSGISYAPATHELQSIQRPFVYFGQLNSQWQWSTAMSVEISVLASTPPFDSETTALGKPYSGFNVGLNWDANKQHRFSMVVGEDIAVGTSPDVSFQLAYQYLVLKD